MIRATRCVDICSTAPLSIYYYPTIKEDTNILLTQQKSNLERGLKGYGDTHLRNSTLNKKLWKGVAGILMVLGIIINENVLRSGKIVNILGKPHNGSGLSARHSALRGV